jgi:hypothetical protein
MNHDVTSIRNAILARYGSLSEPRFHFVRAALEAHAYRALVDELRSSFDITEETDTNNDVSFSLVLRKDGGALGLRLSMVGPYAVLLRLPPAGSWEVVDGAAKTTDAERSILDAVRRFGIEPLDQATLSLPIALDMGDTEPDQCRFYQALFTDNDVLPWEWRASGAT